LGEKLTSRSGSTGRRQQGVGVVLGGEKRTEEEEEEWLEVGGN